MDATLPGFVGLRAQLAALRPEIASLRARRRELKEFTGRARRDPDIRRLRKNVRRRLADLIVTSRILERQLRGHNQEAA